MAKDLIENNYIEEIISKCQWRHWLLLLVGESVISLRLVTKARACKGARREWSPRVTFHAPESVRKCEGMNPHIPKWAPTLGVGVSMDSRIFRKQFQGLKLIGLKSSLYHEKNLEMKMFKMGSHDPFELLKHKLWPKEGLKVKVPIWLSTTKSQ